MILIFLLFSDSLNFIQKKYLHEHIQVVSKTGTDFHWDKVANKLSQFQVVALGEMNHGSHEIFETRNELIYQLHEKHGFDLILFESGFAEIGSVQRDWQKLSPDQLTAGFFYGWRNASFQKLMKYAREKNLMVAGFDVQRTGSTFSQWMVQHDSSDFASLEAQFVKIKNKLANWRTDPSSIEEETQNLTNQYRQLGARLEDPFQVRAIQNRLTQLQYLHAFCQDKNWNKRWAARDQAMADNVLWLLEQFPNRKAIIIAHNFHISKHNPKESVMGETLRQELGDQYFVLGVFAGQGSFHNNSGKEETLTPASDDLDIKHVIEADNAVLSFLAMAPQSIPANQWMFEPIVVNDTFNDLSGGNQVILSKWFDGLLLYDSISPPRK